MKGSTDVQKEACERCGGDDSCIACKSSKKLEKMSKWYSWLTWFYGYVGFNTMAFATTTDITQYWSEARRANFEPSLYLQIEHAQDANTWAAICRTLTWFNLVKLTGGGVHYVATCCSGERLASSAKSACSTVDSGP